MIFVLILLLFIGYGVFFYKKKDFFHIPILLYLGLILIAGLRKDYGNDYINYLINWNEINILSDVIHSSFDKGYTFLVLCFKQFHLGFNSFMLFISFVSIGLKYKFIKKLSPLPFISFFIYYLLFFVINDMEQIRHGVAIAICLYAIVYIIEKKPIKYAICCSIAFLLHSSAILFIPLYFLRKVNLSLKKAGIILLGSIVFSQINYMAVLGWVNSLLLHNSRIEEKITLYQDQTIDGVFSLTFFLRIFVFILYYFVVYRVHLNETKPKIIINGYFYGIVIFLVFNSISILAVRSSAILRCLEIIMVAEILDTAHKKEALPMRYSIFLRNKCLQIYGSQSKTRYEILEKCTNMNIISYISVGVLFLYYFYKFFTQLFLDGYFIYFSI